MVDFSIKNNDRNYVDNLLGFGSVSTQGFFPQQILQGMVQITNAKDFGAIGDGTANDTVAISTALANGGVLRIPDGEYLIDEITIETPVTVIASSNAIFRRNTAPDATSYLLQFAAGSEGSQWYGGIIDGNRESIKSTYDGYSSARSYAGLAVINTENIIVTGLRLINCIYYGIYVDQSSNCQFQGMLTDFCSNNLFNRSTELSIKDLTAVNSDNDGSAVNVRGFTLANSDNCNCDGIIVSTMTGDTAVPSSTNTITGVLVIDVTNCTFNAINVLNTPPLDNVDHLCISVVRGLRCSFTDFLCYAYCGNGVELIACDGSVFSNFILDAAYQNSGASSAANNVGLICHSAPFYPIGNRDRRAVRASQALRVNNGVIQRCGIGLVARSADVVYTNVNSHGNLIQGFKVELAGEESSFAYGQPIIPNNCVFKDCTAEYNGHTGLTLRAGENVLISGGEYSNNSWDQTSVPLSSGISYTQVTNGNVFNETGGVQGPGTGNNQIQFKTGLNFVGGDDYYQNWRVTNSTTSETKTIISYTASTLTATVDSDWDVNPSLDDDVIVWLPIGVGVKTVTAKDTQSFTLNRAVTFEPGTATDDGFPNNTNYYYYTVTFLKPNAVNLGQRITFTNLTGAGDVNGTIFDLDRDEAIIAFDSAVTLSDTGNTTALTGTWDLSGGTSVTGTGIELTEIIGGFWVTDGVEYRQIEASSGSTITIDRAFTSTDSGVTLSYVAVDIAGIPSQKHGVHLSNSYVISAHISDVFAVGNTTANVVYATAENLVPSISLAAETFTSYRITGLANDSFEDITLPADTGGVLIVSDDTRVAGVVKIGASDGSVGTYSLADTGGNSGTLSVSDTLTSPPYSTALHVQNAPGSTTVRIGNGYAETKNVTLMFVGFPP